MTNEISTYEQTAIDFLKATGTKLQTEFIRHSYHFQDDKDTRDIYEITLTNERHRYRFNFGQSINNSGYKIKYIHRGTGIERKEQERIAPTAYDVLACVTKNDPGTFENFCSDYGYDNDSRKAYRIYKAVMKDWKNVELLFTPEQLEQLQEIN